jgi:hypothetical protein
MLPKLTRRRDSKDLKVNATLPFNRSLLNESFATCKNAYLVYKMCRTYLVYGISSIK